MKLPTLKVKLIRMGSSVGVYIQQPIRKLYGLKENDRVIITKVEQNE